MTDRVELGGLTGSRRRAAMFVSALALWLIPMSAAARDVAGSPDDPAGTGTEANPSRDGEAPHDEVPVEAKDDDAEQDRGLGAPRRDGAAARRELLFRDRDEQRGTRYPEGLLPKPGIERSDLGAFDARRRGRATSPPRDVRAGFTVDATVAAGVRYDDNPLLESPEETGGINTEVWGYEVEPKLTLTRRSARTLFQSVVRLSYDALEPLEDGGVKDLGSFDQYGGIQFDTYGQRTSVSMFANIGNATARTALVEDTGVLNDDRTLTYGGGASLIHATSVSSEIQLSASGRWQEIDTGTLADTAFYQAAADYRFNISAADTLGAGAMYERFEPERANTSNVNIFSAVATWSHQASASVSIETEAGAQFITTAAGKAPGDNGDTTIDVFARASLYWAVSSRDGVSFRASRAAEPSAIGELRTTNRLEAAYHRQLSREFSIGVPLTAIFQTGALDDGAGSRSFIQLAPNVVWAFSSPWGLSVQYRYRLENEDGLSVASSNAVFLSLSYFGRLVP